MLRINDEITLPGSVLHLSYSRSSGPGGQNVNKSNTKATLRWNVKRTTRIPEAAKKRILGAERNRIASSGELVITSEKTREQIRNVEDCKKKLKRIILKALAPKKIRKPTKPTKAAVNRRIADKKQAGRHKQLRKRPSLED